MPFAADAVIVKDLTPLSDNQAYSHSFVRSANDDGGTTFVFDVDMGSFPFVTTLESGAVQISSTGNSHGNSGRPLSLHFSGEAIGVQPGILRATQEGHSGSNGKDEPDPHFANGGNGSTGGAGGGMALILNAAQSRSTVTTDQGLNAIQLFSTGASGGTGGGGGTPGYDGGYGGDGGAGGNIVIQNSGEFVFVEGTVAAESTGGNGGHGGTGANRGRSGGRGGLGGNITLDENSNGAWSLVAGGTDVNGFQLISRGGSGGSAGASGTAQGDPGGAGGLAGSVVATPGQSRTISISGAGSLAFLAISQGGNGGSGGEQTGSPPAGDGGSGGAGGSSVSIGGGWDISATSGAAGLFLQNIGGNGAEAGKATIGSGGVGGGGGYTGDIVVLSELDSRITSDGTAIALLAQGGNGGIGRGGDAFGGRGGNGGYAGDVYFDTNASGAVGAGVWELNTTGASSATALTARAIGGNGGTGGGAAGPDNAGAGGNGGSGGIVSVGTGARSIMANSGYGASFASRGGNGGTGGNGAATGRGGDGGSGGKGEDVTVKGNWNIAATGSGAKGLTLASVGGNGGKGGSSSTAASGGTGSGGEAGGGGTAGAVWLISSGDSQIFSDSTAIALTSRGGSGGVGGSGDTFGGHAGSGADGGDVWFNPNGGSGSWEIRTFADDGVAIALESQGGSGGVGGISSSRTSGAGGSGGTAGTVGIANPSGGLTIETFGEMAHALQLLALGAGGGTGGTVEGLGDGGAGGNGGDGGKIEVVGQFDITTIGSGASGIVARSAAGKGADGSFPAGGAGTGGNAQDIDFSFWGETSITTGGTGIFAESIGGVGGTAGTMQTGQVNGPTGGGTGTVTLTSGSSTGATLIVSTTGDQAHAIALSTQGGTGGVGSDRDNGGPPGTGGKGGVAKDILVSSIAIKTETKGAAAMGFSAISQGGEGGQAGDQLGGEAARADGGTGGAPGNLSITASFDVTTAGTGSSGIQLSTIGGAGGARSDGGGKDGVNGKSSDGGSISLTLDSESVGVKTSGNEASGIDASSIGGAIDSTATGSTVGSGGAVSVTIAGGQIVTKGDAAHGIEAASFAGGQLGTNASGTGTSDLVSVTTARGTSVVTSGEASHAIFASSIGSGNSTTADSTKVLINHSGTAVARGAGSAGIFVQSSGHGAGTIGVGIDESGVVVGGGASDDANQPIGSAIFVGGGTQENSLLNAGLIRAGFSGQAITYSGSGALLVSNFGTISGSVVTGSAANGGQATSAKQISLSNHQGGILETGRVLEVGTLTNAGHLLPGGQEALQTTHIAGDLVQSGTGLLAIDLDTASGKADRLTVGGSATVAGRVEISLTDPGQALPGAGSLALITAGDGLTTGPGLTVTQSAVAQYRLQQSNDQTLRLHHDIDFANDSLTQVLNDNQDQVAAHLQDLYEAGGLESGLAGDLIALEGAQSYARIVREFGAEVAVDNQLTSVASTRLFNDALLSCATTMPEGQLARFFDEGQCVYAGFGGRGFNRDASADNLGFSGSSWTFTGGGQIDLGQNWSLGGAVSYERRRVNLDQSSATSRGNQVFAGLSLKHRIGDAELSAAHGFGYGAFDIDRSPLAGQSVNGKQGLWSTSGRIQAAYIFGAQDLFIKPRLAFSYDHYFSSSFSESGSSSLGLEVETDSETYWSAEPAVELGGEFLTDGGWLLRPHLGLGITQYLNSPSSSLQARFASSPSGVAPFTAQTDYDRTWGNVELGLDVFVDSHVTLRVAGLGQFSGNNRLYGGTFRAELPF